MTCNKKSISPVVNFVVWLVVFAIICIIGITNVFALSNPNPTSVQLYDNLGSYLTAINTDVSPGNGTYTWYGNVGLTANSYGAAVGFQSNDLLVSGHMYSLTIYASADNGSSALSIKNNVGLGTSLSNAVSSYLNGSNVEISYTSTSNDYYYYIIKVNITAGYLVVPFNRTVSCSTCTVSFGGYELKDLGDSSGLTQNEVNNIINNQTTIIQNNITQVEENIKKSNEEMENTLKNEIKNTENNIKDGIKEGFESCRDSYNLFSYSLFNMSQTYGLIELDSSKSYVLSVKLKEGQSIPPGLYFGFTDKSFTVPADPPRRIDILSNGKFIGSPNSEGWYVRNIDPNSIYKYVFVFPKNINVEQYFYINLNEGSVPKPYEPYGEQVCKNRIDETNKKLDEQNETSKGIFGKIKDLFNWLTNKDDADVSGAGNVAGWLPPGPVDSLINLPLTFLTNVNTSLSKTCSPLDVNLPYVNKVVQIPCLNTIFNQITGLNSFWTWVGTISSVVILFKYLVALYDYFDRLTTLQANFISDWGGV